MKAAGKRPKANSSGRAAESGVKSDSKPALATTEAAAVAPTSATVQSLLRSPTDRQPRQQQATSAPPKPPPLLLGAVAVKPKPCKFWRTAAGCRAGSVCKFRHATASTDGNQGGGGGGDALKDFQEEAPAAEVRVAASLSTAEAFVSGPGGRWGPSSGATSRADPGLSGFGVHTSGVGVALGEGMEEDRSVDDLVSAMSTLMVPRHLRVRLSAQWGEPIG